MKQLATLAVLGMFILAGCSQPEPPVVRSPEPPKNPQGWEDMQGWTCEEISKWHIDKWKDEQKASLVAHWRDVTNVVEFDGRNAEFPWGISVIVTKGFHRGHAGRVTGYSEEKGEYTVEVFAAGGHDYSQLSQAIGIPRRAKLIGVPADALRMFKSWDDERAKLEAEAAE